MLDEADEMLSQGFKEQIYDIYRYLPPATQVLRLPPPAQHTQHTRSAAARPAPALAACWVSAGRGLRRAGGVDAR